MKIYQWFLVITPVVLYPSIQTWPNAKIWTYLFWSSIGIILFTAMLSIHYNVRLPFKIDSELTVFFFFIFSATWAPLRVYEMAWLVLIAQILIYCILLIEIYLPHPDKEDPAKKLNAPLGWALLIGSSLYGIIFRVYSINISTPILIAGLVTLFTGVRILYLRKQGCFKKKGEDSATCLF